MNQLKVFVSSTCYDLSQLRADLFDFISNLGYQPVLSEFDSFPINPQEDTLNNCIENVRNADIFILIIGNRYGSITESGKSITNTEYSYAKQLRIPIYTFIYKPLTTLLEVWRNNKTANLSYSVESTQVFEFIENLKAIDKNWCYEFEKAQDIQIILKKQFGYLFKDALLNNKLIRGIQDADLWKKLSPAAIDILVRKKDYYELIFFVQVLRDELSKYEDVKLDLEYKILLGSNVSILNDSELLSWMEPNLATLIQFTHTAMNLFDKAFKKYYGEPGVPSDIKGLYYVAKSLARLYNEMLCWSIRISSVFVRPENEIIIELFSQWVLLSAERIWDYPKLVQDNLNSALEKLAAGETNIKLEAVLTMEVDGDVKDRLNQEIKNISSRH